MRDNRNTNAAVLWVESVALKRVSGPHATGPVRTRPAMRAAPLPALQFSVPSLLLQARSPPPAPPFHGCSARRGTTSSLLERSELAQQSTAVKWTPTVAAHVTLTPPFCTPPPHPQCEPNFGGYISMASCTRIVQNWHGTSTTRRAPGWRHTESRCQHLSSAVTSVNITHHSVITGNQLSATAPDSAGTPPSPGRWAPRPTDGKAKGRERGGEREG